MVKKFLKNLQKLNRNYYAYQKSELIYARIDLYMKSGLYITEIVKRLFQNQVHKDKFPDEEERLKWIFENQVYGLAPTEIIYAISTHYILGFAQTQGLSINSKHFKKLDALPYAQGKMDKTLEEKLDELFGEKPN